MPWRRRIFGGALEGGEHHADAAVLPEVGDRLDAAADHVDVGEAERAGDAEHARAALGRDVDVAAVAARRRGHEEDVLALDERAEGVVDRVEHLGHAAQHRAAPGRRPAAPRPGAGLAYGLTFSRSCCACSSASWASSGTLALSWTFSIASLAGVRGVLLELLGARLDLVGGLLGGLRAVLDLLGGLLGVLLQLLALVLELLGVLLDLLAVRVTAAGGEAEGADDEQGARVRRGVNIAWGLPWGVGLMGSILSRPGPPASGWLPEPDPEPRRGTGRQGSRSASPVAAGEGTAGGTPDARARVRP